MPTEEPVFAAPDIPLERLDSDALRTVQRLRRAGFKAYFVGGCVRDLLVGLRPKDFDVATSAHPHQVKETFRNCRLIGRRFRLAHVFFRGGKIIEVSTFRANPLDVLEDLPDDLLITRDNVFGTAEEDARRRDFTVNGLFYDPEEGRVIDYVGGRADLDGRMMRTIGDPELRMREDPVRILRAIRFAARLSFDLEPATRMAMATHVGEIRRCAPPRVLEETLKLLRGGSSRRAFELLDEFEALRILLAPVADQLAATGPTGRARFFAALEALDDHVHHGERPSEAVLLASALMWLPRGEGPHQEAALDRVLTEMVSGSRLPRRIADRCRLLLATLPVLLGHRRARHFSPAHLVHQNHFPEALTLLELYVRATGDGSDAFERWAARATGEEVVEPTLPEGALLEAGPDAKRRPRRRRRRR